MNLSFDRRSWIMLALAGAILFYSFAITIYVTLLPTDGWEFQFNLVQRDPGFVFTEYYGSGPTPLQSGDVLVAIEGKPVERVFEEAFALQSPAPPNWRIGSTVEYTIRRAGSERVLAVRLFRLFPQGVWNYLTSLFGAPFFYLMTLVMVLIGLVVFLNRPRYLPAQLLLLFSWSLSGSQLGWSPPSVAVVLDPAALFLVHTPVFFSIWQVTILPVIVHLLLVFPVVKLLLARHPRPILLALYVPPQIGPWLALGLNLGRPAAVISTWNTVQAVQILTAFVLMVASVAHTFRTVRDPVVLAQMRWVALGVLGGFMGSVLGWLFITLSGASIDYYALLFFPILLLPISLAIAILRYRLFDIDFIIRRTLIYGVVSALRNRIQAAIDRAFYRQKYDAQKTLEAFVAGLQDRTDLQGLAVETQAVIEDTLQPESVKVWLVAGAGRPPRPSA